MNKKRAVIIETDDHEAIYLDGKLIVHAEMLGEGDGRFYILEFAEKYGLKRCDFECKYLFDMLIEEFPNKLEDLYYD